MIVTVQIVLLWILIGACIGSFVFFLLNRSRLETMKSTKWLTMLTAAVAVVLLIVRIIASGRLPFTSGLDFGFWLEALALLVLCVITVKLHVPATAFVIYPITVVLGIWMTSFSMEKQAIAPALQSYWMDFHVSTAIISYTSFLFSFVFSVMILAGGKKKHANLPEAEVLSEWAHRACMIGLAFLTIVLITGAVWAEYAWGTFWSWDPKETWALITWLIYALYLHLRLRGLSDKSLAWINVIGLIAVVFTLFGVSYLLPGLHSYIE